VLFSSLSSLFSFSSSSSSSSSFSFSFSFSSFSSLFAFLTKPKKWFAADDKTEFSSGPVNLRGGFKIFKRTIL